MHALYRVGGEGWQGNHSCKGDTVSGTRQLVIELCQELSIHIEITHLPLQGLRQAEECFITSSKRNIMLVVKVDDQSIGEGIPEGVTLRLMDAFFRLKPSIALQDV